MNLLFLYYLLHEITGLWCCTVICVEGTLRIVLTLENHRYSCVDSFGTVTVAEFFSRTNNITKVNKWYICYVMSLWMYSIKCVLNVLLKSSFLAATCSRTQAGKLLSLWDLCRGGRSTQSVSHPPRPGEVGKLGQSKSTNTLAPVRLVKTLYSANMSVPALYRSSLSPSSLCLSVWLV